MHTQQSSMGCSRRLRRWLAVAAIASLGCTSTIERAGVALLYDETEHPAAFSRLDVPYVEGDSAALDKQSLDLFWPEPEAARDSPWPTVIFVHGGGWSFGDRAHSVAGADIYRNIGRYLASHGIGAAVISYRLQPAVDWHAQIDDVSRALDFVRAEVPTLGGRSDAIFLAGHSAGAWLAARVGIERAAGDGAGEDVCGLVLVSGAAYDLDDDETWALGADRAWFAERFDDGEPDWVRRASVTPLLSEASPPALVLYASGEPARLRRQSEVLVSAYDRAGAQVTRIVVPGEDHARIVLTLSRDDKTAGPAMLRFVESMPCGVDATAG
jgi:acetyl esterase/lipase